MTCLRGLSAAVLAGRLVLPERWLRFVEPMKALRRSSRFSALALDAHRAARPAMLVRPEDRLNARAHKRPKPPGITRLCFQVVVIASYRPYPANNSSAPSPDRATVT